MTFKRSSGGVWSDITTTLKRRASGAWASIDTIRRKSSGSWVVVWKRISLTDQLVSDLTSVGTATAGYRLNASGIAESRVRASYATLETWIQFGSASDYECRVTVLSGTLTSGTAGSWLSLGTSREWYASQSVVGDNDCSLSVEIRNAASLAVVASATISLQASKV